MALKPPPLSEVIHQVNQLVGADGLRGEVDRNARLLVQSALQRLDVVARDEFDAQTEVLARAQERIRLLESELGRLSELLDELESRDRR